MADAARDDAALPLPAAIAAALEEDIVFGRLHPRERLIEEELAERFRATRHTVRRALAELERMRLIERIPHRGALVKAYSPEEVRQLYALREMLETQAAALIPLPLAGDALAPLHALQQQHAAAVAEGDTRAVFRADLAFHRALYAHCGNLFLAETIEELGQRAQVIRYANLRSQGEHGMGARRARRHARRPARRRPRGAAGALRRAFPPGARSLSRPAPHAAGLNTEDLRRKPLPMTEKPEPVGLTRGLTNYGDMDFARYLRLSMARSMGLSSSLLKKPVVGIAATYSEFNNCHRGVPELVEAVKRGVLAAGGLPREFPTISLGEPFLNPTALVFRNLMAMDTEEMVSGQPMDAVVLVGGCDKTVPAQLMGAISADVPAIQVVTGPMSTGRWRGERLGACTDCRRFWAKFRAGEIDQETVEEIEGNRPPPPAPAR
ncbi:dihydroxy-acid dehydratase domain-containing protein [Teichococcus aestuarii]|uniref:dihydroxy-acid dehydratase domain-containing protein n=1 Tax=Teichococcus aestuarii TaxID=568898 RepID=UPI00360EB3DC